MLAVTVSSVYPLVNVPASMVLLVSVSVPVKVAKLPAVKVACDQAEPVHTHRVLDVEFQ